jgi:general secretion pathway protein L
MASNEWLLLRLPAQDDAPLSWAAVDASGQLLAPPADEHDPQLAGMAAGRRVALLVPASDVSHLEVQLPTSNEARLLQLVPFALEDQVSEDVEDLHFAVGPRNAETGMVPVAVVNRERMSQWLARVASLQLVPTRVMAESELLPVLPGHVTMLADEDQLVLRRGGGAPLLMPAADPAFALEMLLGSPNELAGVNLAVYASADDWPRHAAAIEPLRERVASYNVQLESGGLPALYARALPQGKSINLLQGAFRPDQSSAGGWERWRGVAVALLALVLLDAAGSWWQMRGLRAESDQLDRSMANLFSSVFPGQQPAADPRRQFEARLAQIAGGAADKGELLPMLAALAAAQQNTPVAKLESISFRSGSMQLRVGAPDASTLEQFSQSLRAGGYNVEILSAQSQGEAYSGQIAVKVQGS